jgi:hypothetical protein
VGLHATIDVSYSRVYPIRAVQFFKEYHSEGRVFERSRKGERVIIEQASSIVATGSLAENEILAVFVSPDMQGQGYGKGS